LTSGSVSLLIGETVTAVITVVEYASFTTMGATLMIVNVIVAVTPVKENTKLSVPV